MTTTEPATLAFPPIASTLLPAAPTHPPAASTHPPAASSASVQPPGSTASSTPSQVSALINQPTLIQTDRLKFLILDAPHYDNLSYYIQSLKSHNAMDLVRTCERTYDETVVMDAGITPHELVFPDGEPPSPTIIREWLDLVEDASRRNTAVGVHCLAGLGRAPVLVVIALIEKGNMSSVEAIELVRSKRRGAINKRQLEYLMSYKRQTKTRKCCGLF